MNITKEQADKVIVPLAFVQAFNTLAHNYSLTAMMTPLANVAL